MCGWSAAAFFCAQRWFLFFFFPSPKECIVAVIRQLQPHLVKRPEDMKYNVGSRPRTRDVGHMTGYWESGVLFEPARDRQLDEVELKKKS